MCYKIPFLLIFILFIKIGSTQTCLPNGIIFTNQGQIDNFPSNYPGCSTVLGNIIIGAVDNNFNNLDSLIYITQVDGDLTIGDEFANQINNISGLSNLISVGGDLRVENNLTLNSLNGLDNLVSIGGYLLIKNNDFLLDLNGLESLNEVTQILISLNDGLLSLAGIDSVDVNSLTMVNINYNNSLTTCNIYSVCNYIALENSTVSISFNNSGCDNLSQVQESCISGIQNEVGYLNFQVSPNPTKDVLYISASGNNEQLVQTRIYSLTGKLLISEETIINQDIIKVADLSPGLYLLELELKNGQKSSQKFIKE